MPDDYSVMMLADEKKRMPQPPFFLQQYQHASSALKFKLAACGGVP